MCRVLEVSASGFYRWRGRKPSFSCVKREQLEQQVLDSYARYKARYGAKAGPEICDLLFVDDGILARMARPLLKRQRWELISDR